MFIVFFFLFIRAAFGTILEIDSILYQSILSVKHFNTYFQFPGGYIGFQTKLPSQSLELNSKTSQVINTDIQSKPHRLKERN